MRPPLVIVIMVVLVTAIPATAQNRYTVQALGPVGNSIFSEPLDRISLNAHGHAAGFALNAAGSTYRAIGAQGANITDLGTLGGDPAAKAHAINDDGVIVGASGTANTAGGGSPFTARRAFSYANGSFVDLGGEGSAAYGVNNAGLIVGESDFKPVVFANSRTRDLDVGPNAVGGRGRGINTRGQIVGSVRIVFGNRGLSHAFLWNDEVPFDLGTLGGTTSGAEAINDAGQIVGWSANAAGEIRPFLYENGVMQDLGTLGGDTRAAAINSAGHVVGTSFVTVSAGITSRAFLQEGGQLIALNNIAPLRTGAGVGMSGYSYATAINDRGQIAGIGSYVATANTTPASYGFVLTPVVEIFPPIAVVASGAQVALNAKSALPATSYQWRRNDVPIAGGTSATLLLANASDASTAGTYSCRATTAGGVYESATVPVRVAAASEPPSRLVNLSIRSLAGSGNDTLIIGFAVGGAGASGTKPLLLRANGPALATFGVSGALPDPVLTIFEGSAVLATNDNWGGAEAVMVTARAVGAFVVADPQSRDAAIYRSGMPAGTYSAHITGNGSTTGTVLAEIYDASIGATAAFGVATRLINVSARKQVGTGDHVLIAGFVIAGNTARTVLIRGIGPAFAAFGVSGALADPKIELYRGSVLLAASDNWAGNPSLRLAAASTGAFELPDGASKDAALLVTLAPGAYTVQLAGADGGSGVGLVEIYELP